MKKFLDYLNESCDCWKGHKRVPGTKPCAPGSCVKESVELDESLHPSEVAGNPKMYDASTVKKAYYHKSVSASDKESLARHLDRHHGNKEWRKPVKEERGLWDNIHAKQKRIKAGSGEKMRKPGSKGAPTDAALKASQNEELSADEQFDLIEEFIEDLSLEHDIHSDAIWEDFESIDDEELYEAAVDAKGLKSSTGGLTQKGRDHYNRESGGHLKAPVTTPPSKLKAGSKAANRRKSFCARMSGVDGPMKKPNGEPTRKALALRKWNC